MHQAGYESKLESVFRTASMKDKTVIITTLNDAWAKPGSVFDLFLESFRLGNETQWLLNHLVVITWDQKTNAYCLALHKHCYQVETKGANFTGEVLFMTPTYLHMMWRRTEFLTSVLEMGYNFVFTVYIQNYTCISFEKKKKSFVRSLQCTHSTTQDNKVKGLFFFVFLCRILI